MDIIKEIEKILPKELIKLSEPMSRHTSFEIGGPADIFLSPATEEELVKLLKLIDKYKVNYYILGKGSNLLVSDKGYRGIIISMDNIDKSCRVEGLELFVSAGISLKKATELALEHSLSGFEFAYGIPGSVGGAVFMNAGAYDGEIKDILTKVKLIDRDRQIRWLDASELDLSYRHSNIEENGYIVLEACFELKKADKSDIESKMQELMSRRIDKQPLEYPSAGSTFKRPVGQFAGKLIDDAGLRGYRLGGASVSSKHCGFIINESSATADDVLSLIGHIKATVKDKFDVELEAELKLLGEF